MEDPEIIFDPLPSAPLREYIIERLALLNVARTGDDKWRPVNFFLKSFKGEWQGGLIGDMWGGWLTVRFLWLAEEVRGRRLGTTLMDSAEAYAVERGCHGATLDTHSYEALGFYQKRGYEVFGQLDDNPPGHTKYYLRKRLT